ncbi:crotonyl-CoA carboxylase/reductase [Umezawaea endophytica]|uniref:Crotonyl-CoA carboxylase/reductase n=1 Tax=Umezawaea endophytica TaxID=1654476 RepID=A0A9X2VV53_9PSEU|nr:crotonyl-CoA carboxylase/reductase [Umezawaea endophytica]MCS7483505.1 crotonyl-CoA carboxylase/reductase [Umezawaea endophytica]
MDALAAAAVRGAGADELLGHPVPERYRAAHTRVEDTDMFQGVEDKDVRKSIRVGDVPMPELAPDEVLVALMASSINYNTVWSSTFDPVPTFAFLKHFGREGGWATRHDQPFHVLGSDASGVIVRTGVGVRRWQVGDRVVVTPVHVDDQEPAVQNDGMIGTSQRAWGYETNYGGLAHYAVVRASQLVPKPAHLTWEEAASTPVCAATAYRMLISERGARMKLGDVVLVWGAAGGLGAFGVQLVKQAGGVAVGVVGSGEKADLVRKLGCDVVIDRSEIGIGDPGDPGAVLKAGKRIGSIIRKETGEDPHIVFDHVGRATFGISMFVARRGGSVVTCGSSTGYQHQYDNRYLWMKLKRLIGSHGANLQEQWESNRLFDLGQVLPVLSEVYSLDGVGEAARVVQTNGHVGKIGVLCLAPEAGLGVSDQDKRDRLAAVRPPVLETKVRT